MSTVLLKPETKFDVGKIVCVGQNYLKHIAELKSKRSKEPILFLKPSTTLLMEKELIVLPDFSNEIHHEVELAILIGKETKNITREMWKNYVIGVGIALDLTLRDLQRNAKKEGLPWAISKGFDGSCPISSFVPVDQISDIQKLHIELSVNGEQKQIGFTGDMIWPVDELLVFISKIFTLEPGDIVLTGTPAGVGRIDSGDHIEAKISEIGSIVFDVK